MQSFRIILALILVAAIHLAPQPANARRTVIDLALPIRTSGYCSPLTSTYDTADCAAQQLGFVLQLSGQSYDNFYINSNGVLSLGSIQEQLAWGPINPPETLGDYAVPVFSPNFNDGQGYQFDGQFVARVVSSSSNILELAFFTCTSHSNCGLITAEVGFGYAPSFYLTLEPLADGGFSLGYSYDQGIAGTQGTYGFNLPSTGLFEATGPLQNQTFLFDANGQLTSAVPEPSSWLMMLGGFAMMASTLRRKGRRAMSPQPV